MNEILNTNESKKAEQNWMSKQELMDICKCSKTTLEQIINDFSSQVNLATQNHIKKGGYHNSEVFYDDYLVNMITAELAKHNTNQNTGVIQKQMSMEVLEIKKEELVSNEYKYTKEDICSICNCSARTFESFAPQPIAERDFISVGSSHN